MSRKRKLGDDPKIIGNKLRYISLLRGVNVGGGNRILKDQLKKAYENCGFVNVVTYIQSGNIAFDAPLATSREELKKLISKALQAYLSNIVEVLVFPVDEWEAIVKAAPFTTGPSLSNISTASCLRKVKTYYVTFLCTAFDESKRQRAVASLMQGLLDTAKDTVDICIINNEVSYVPVLYLTLPNGCGNSLYNSIYIDKVTGVASTTRNLETMNALLDLGK